MIKRTVRNVTVNILKPLEFSLETFYKKNDVQTVWIIGPPRSGTTLLYNILSELYSFSYISNFTARFAEIPLLATCFCNAAFPRSSKNDFTFYYGQSKSPSGPHEAGNLWYRWFPGGDQVYVQKNFWDAKSLKDFRRVICSYCNFKGGAGLFKNTYNSMRITPILEAFPNALFLVCDRAPIDIAQSILKARMKFNNDKNRWWALPPKEINEIKDHPYWEQVVEQVYYTYNQIESDKKMFNSKNFHSVSYKNICTDTNRELKKIEDFFFSKNLKITSRKNGISTENIFYSSGQKVSNIDYKRIQTKVKELWNNEE